MMPRFLKLLIILILLVGVGVVSLLFYVGTDHFHGWVRGQVTGFLEDRFELDAHFGAIDFGLWGGRLRIEDLRLSSRNFPVPEPAIEIARVALDYRLIEYFSPEVSLDGLVLEGLRLNLRRDPNDRLNLSNMFSRPGGEPQPAAGVFSPVRLKIGRITLSDAVVTYEDRTVEFDSSSAGFDMRLDFDRERSAYRGWTLLRGLSLDVDGFPVPVSDFEADFELFENSMRFSPARFRSDQLEATIEGAIIDLMHFHYDFQVDLDADLLRFDQPDFSGVFDEARVRVGGRVIGRGGDFLLEGRAESERLLVRGIDFTGFRSDIVVDGEGAAFSSALFSVFDGRGEASGEIGWRREITSRAEVAASGLRLSKVFQAFDVSGLPIDAGSQARASIEWPGLDFEALSGRGRLTYTGAVFDPKREDLGSVSFVGGADLGLGEGRVGFDNGQLATGLTDADYQGSLSFDAHLAVRGSVASRSAEEVQKMGDLFDLVPRDLLEEYPFRLTGVFEGEFDLVKPGGEPLTLTAEAKASEIRFRDEPMGTLSTGIRWADGFLAFEGLTLRRRQVLLEADLGINLEPTSLAELSLSVEEVPLDWLYLLDLVEPESPLRGTVAGTLLLRPVESGDLEGRGQFELRDVHIFEQDVSSVRGDLSIQGSEVRLGDLRAEVFGGELRGDGTYNTETSRFQARLEGRGIRVDRVAGAPEVVRGVFDLEVSGVGTIEAPQLDLRLRSSEMAIGEQILRNVELTSRYEEGRNPFQLRAGFLEEGIEASGVLYPVEPYRVEAEMGLRDIEIAPLLDHFFEFPLSGFSGVATGRIRVAGDLLDPGGMRVEGRFEALDLRVQDYEVALAEPFNVSYRPPHVILDQCRLVGSRTDVRIAGRIELAEVPQLTMTLVGEVNLLLANAFLEGGDIQGNLSFETNLLGPIENPRIVGAASLEDAYFSYPDIPFSILGGEGRFRFTANQLSIDAFSARTDYGTVNVSGGVFLDGLQPVRWQVNVLGQGLALEYPRDVLTVFDADLDLIRSDQRQLLSGVVYIRSLEYTENVSIAELIFSLTRSDSVATPAPSEEDIALDLTVEAYQSLRVSNNLAHLTGSADLSVIGTLDHPVVLGSATVDDGYLTLEGNRYDVTRGTVTFNNPRRTSPHLNFEAETQVREYSIAVLIRGPADQFQLSFRSDPPLATASIVSLLAAGQTQEEIFGAEPTDQTRSSTLVAFGAGALLSKTLGEAVESGTSRLLGFERFSIDPFISDGRDRDPGARITLGKQITRELNVTSISSVTNSLQEQAVVIQYRITDWLTVVGTSDSDGQVAVDFRFRKRF